MLYYFYGDSHQRHFFDAIVDFTAGSAALDSVAKKHQNFVSGNFLYEWVEYVGDLSNRMIERCIENTNSSSARKIVQKYKMILHFGHWDLSSASVRRFLQHKISLPKFINALKSIYSGTTECVGLVEIIWITTVPYPVCYDDVKHCLKSKGYFPSRQRLNSFA